MKSNTVHFGLTFLKARVHYLQPIPSIKTSLKFLNFQTCVYPSRHSQEQLPPLMWHKRERDFQKWYQRNGAVTPLGALTPVAFVFAADTDSNISMYPKTTLPTTDSQPPFSRRRARNNNTLHFANIIKRWNSLDLTETRYEKYRILSQNYIRRSGAKLPPTPVRLPATAEAASFRY